MKNASDLYEIPGVGKATVEDFKLLSIFMVKDLINKDPEMLYNMLCDITGTKQDKCVLYVFKTAIYYASNTNHDPELLKWWNWKNR